MRQARLKVSQQIYLKISVIFSPPFLQPTLEPGCISERLAFRGLGCLKTCIFQRHCDDFYCMKKYQHLKEMNKEREKKNKKCNFIILCYQDKIDMLFSSVIFL